MDHAVVDHRGAGVDDGLTLHSFRFLCSSLWFFFLLGGGDGEEERERARERDGCEALGELWSAFCGSLCLEWQGPVGNSMLHGTLDSVFLLVVFHHTLDSDGSFVSCPYYTHVGDRIGSEVA